MAFVGCRSLTSITVDSKNPAYQSIDENLYSKDGKTLIQYAIGKTDTHFAIPSDVTSFGSYAFSGCSSLTSVTFAAGSQCTSIGYGAFEGCSSLTSIEIPENVTSIGYYAFYNCMSLTSIKIPASVTSIGEYAFYLCKSLTDVYYSGSEADWANISIGTHNESLLNATMHYNWGSSQGLLYELSEDGTYYVVAGIGTCTDTDVIIPKTYLGLPVKEIGAEAFYDCDSITSIEIPDSVTSIGSSAFSSCVRLTSIEIPEGVTNIGYDAFVYCDKLVEVINRSSLPLTAGSSDYGYVAAYAKEVHKENTKIVNQNGYLFYTYDGVNYLLGYVGTDTALTLPENYNGQSYEIYKFAFYNCTSITSIKISAGVTSFGEYAFVLCSNLTSIEISDSVTSIGSWSFAVCSNLTSVTFAAGSQCTIIGSWAFAGCSNLTIVNYAGTVQQWNAISKESYWDEASGDYTVYCTNGTIAK